LWRRQDSNLRPRGN